MLAKRDLSCDKRQKWSRFCINNEDYELRNKNQRKYGSNKRGENKKKEGLNKSSKERGFEQKFIYLDYKVNF